MSFFGGRRQQDEIEGSPSESSGKPSAPPTPRQPVGFETVLGSNTHITGEFHGAGNARFDGILEGTLEIDGNILIGETAKITADINARNISIAGAVRGNVHGNKVQILRTGRVWGDINAAAITTEEGAFIDGKITMVSHEAALQGLEPPALAEPEPLAEPDFIAAVDAAREAEMDAEAEDDAIGYAYEVEDEEIDKPADTDYEEDDYKTLILDADDPLDDEDDRLPIDEDGAVG